MAKITRKVAKIFGSNAGTDEIAQFGSLAAGSPAFSTDPATIQALGNWLTGWFGGVEAGNSPAIEDMNAFCYTMAYQIAYLMQQGIAEWDSTTTYYIGSLAQDGDGNVYVSLTDNNLNNVLLDPSNWQLMLTSSEPVYTSSCGNFSLAANTGATLITNLTESITTLGGKVEIEIIPDASALGSNWTVRPASGGTLAGAELQIIRSGSPDVEIARFTPQLEGVTTTTGYMTIPTTSIKAIDFVSFGTWTYSIYLVTSGRGISEFTYSQMRLRNIPG